MGSCHTLLSLLGGGQLPNTSHGQDLVNSNGSDCCMPSDGSEFPLPPPREDGLLDCLCGSVWGHFLWMHPGRVLSNGGHLRDPTVGYGVLYRPIVLILTYFGFSVGF